MAILLNEAERKWLIDNYDYHTIDELRIHFNCGREAIEQTARKLGLKKNKPTSWSSKQVEYLCENLDAPIKFLMEKLNKSAHSIRNKKHRIKKIRIDNQYFI